MKAAPLKQRQKMARRFRKFRAKHKLTQAQLSKLIELDRTQVNRIEKARAYPYHSTIERLNALEQRIKQGQDLHAGSH